MLARLNCNKSVTLRHRRATRRLRRGTSVVEFTFVASLLSMMMFGIIEFSWMSTTRGALSNGVARAARCGAVGKPVAELREIVRSKSGLPVSDTYITIEYNTAGDGSGEWVAVGDDPESGYPALANDAPHGKPLRVSVNGWPYQMVTGPMFAWLPPLRDGTLPMSASVVVRRE